jgi:hypothetical protein
MILLIPVLFGSLAASASAQATPEADLVGVYVCNGVSADGEPYQAIVEIVKDHDTYQLVWSFESEIVGVGLGIRSGNVLAVMHYSGRPGVVAYTIEQGPRLVGQWTVVGAEGALFSETLTKAPDDAPAARESEKPKPQQRRQPRRQPREVVVARSHIWLSPELTRVRAGRPFTVGLIRFGGHLPRGGYDVDHGRPEIEMTAAQLHRGVQGRRGALGPG